MNVMGREWKCYECNKVISTSRGNMKQHLFSHVRIRTDIYSTMMEKGFLVGKKCQLCDTEFNDFRMAARHIAITHQLMKPYLPERLNTYLFPTPPVQEKGLFE